MIPPEKYSRDPGRFTDTLLDKRRPIDIIYDLVVVAHHFGCLKRYHIPVGIIGFLGCILTIDINIFLYIINVCLIIKPKVLN